MSDTEVVIMFLRLILHPTLACLLLMLSMYANKSSRYVLWGLSLFFSILFVIQFMTFLGNGVEADDLRLYLTIPIEVLIIGLTIRGLWQSSRSSYVQ